MNPADNLYRILQSGVDNSLIESDIQFLLLNQYNIQTAFENAMIDLAYLSQTLEIVNDSSITATKTKKIEKRLGAGELIAKLHDAIIVATTLRDETHIAKENMDIYDKSLSLLQYSALFSVKTGRSDTNFSQFILDRIKAAIFDPFGGTMTVTFGEVVESHAGMQQIGQLADRGFNFEEMINAKAYFEDKGCECIMVRLNDFLPQSERDNSTEQRALEIARADPKYQAWLLIARNGLKCINDDNKGNDLLTELLMYKWDDKLFNPKQKIVQNKQARHNVNFSDLKQEANFPIGEGTTIPWGDVPLLSNLKAQLSQAFGPAAEDLSAEGNLYYASNSQPTGIGYHSDTERRKVIGVRMGRSMNIHFIWYYNSKPQGWNMSATLNPGDIYCMSEKTVGDKDWVTSRGRYNLRHAAGASKYTTKTPTIHIENITPSSEHVFVKTGREAGHPDVNVGDIYFARAKQPKVPQEPFKLVSH